MELERSEVQRKIWRIRHSIAIMKSLETELAAGAMPKGSAAKIEEADLKKNYVEAISSFADLNLIAKAKLQICRLMRCMVPAAA